MMEGKILGRRRVIFKERGVLFGLWELKLDMGPKFLPEQRVLRLAEGDKLNFADGYFFVDTDGNLVWTDKDQKEVALAQRN